MATAKSLQVCDLINTRYGIITELFSSEYGRKSPEQLLEVENDIFRSNNCETEIEKYLYEAKRTIKILEARKILYSENDDITLGITEVINYLEHAISIAEEKPEIFTQGLNIRDQYIGNAPVEILRLIFIEVQYGINPSYKAISKEIYDSCTMFNITHIPGEFRDIRNVMYVYNTKKDYVRAFSNKYSVKDNDSNK